MRVVGVSRKAFKVGAEKVDKTLCSPKNFPRKGSSTLRGIVLQRQSQIEIARPLWVCAGMVEGGDDYRSPFIARHGTWAVRQNAASEAAAELATNIQAAHSPVLAIHQQVGSQY